MENSRQLKFRAWSKEDKKMSVVNSLIRPYGEQSMYVGEHDPSGCPKWDDDILMQYVGRKDKNCKEIYEGDVVLFDYDGIEESDPCRIYWSDGDMGWVLHSNNEKWGDRLNEFVSADLRIIGNIYENPDLLKEQS